MKLIMYWSKCHDHSEARTRQVRHNHQLSHEPAQLFTNQSGSLTRGERFYEIRVEVPSSLIQTPPHAKTYVFLSFLTSMIILSPEMASVVALIQMVGGYNKNTLGFGTMKKQTRMSEKMLK